MDWNNSVWLYCERGMSTALLAEPVNAASNAIYLLAVIAALLIYRKTPFAQKSADHMLLIGLTLIVGAGSLAFHLFANQWSELAHVFPILLFFMVYLAFALNRFLELPPGWTVLIVGLFVVASLAGLTMTCTFLDQGLQPPWSTDAENKGGATSCLNGSGGYFPSALALALLAFVLRARGQKAASSVSVATILFVASLVFQAVDHLPQVKLTLWNHAFGTHFAWHIFNGAVLFILLRSTMVHQNTLPVQEIIPPDPKQAKKL